MRYGLTKAQKDAAQEARRGKLAQWRSWFAWLPVQLEDGSKVWWEWVSCCCPHGYTWVYQSVEVRMKEAMTEPLCGQGEI